MECDLYKVTTGSVEVARYMPLETALILVKALMVEYYNEPELEYVIKREYSDEKALEEDIKKALEKLRKEKSNG